MTSIDPTDPDALQYLARRIVGDMAALVQGSLLVRRGNEAVADAFSATRLAGDRGDVFGTLPSGANVATNVERAIPAVGAFV